MSKFIVALLIIGLAVSSWAAPKHPVSQFTLISAVVTSDVDTTTGEIVTVASNVFTKVELSSKTQITQNALSLTSALLKSGTKLSCKGNWEPDSNTFKATYIFIGDRMPADVVSDKIAIACQNINKNHVIASTVPDKPREPSQQDAKQGQQAYLAAFRPCLDACQDTAKRFQTAWIQSVADNSVLLDNDWIDNFHTLAAAAQNGSQHLADITPIPPEFKEFQALLVKGESEYQQYIMQTVNSVDNRDYSNLKEITDHYQKSCDLIEQATDMFKQITANLK